MSDPISSLSVELARQGLGFLLAVIEGGIILFLLRRADQKDEAIKQRDDIIVSLQEKRIDDLKDTSEKFIAIGKDMVNGMAALKEANQGQTNALTRLLDGVKRRRK